MKLIRELFIGLLLGLSFLSVSYTKDSVAYAEKQEFTYFASRKSDKYHRPSCYWVQRIKPQNLIGFKNREEATKADYRPCKVCRP